MQTLHALGNHAAHVGFMAEAVVVDTYLAAGSDRVQAIQVICLLPSASLSGHLSVNVAGFTCLQSAVATLNSLEPFVNPAEALPFLCLCCAFCYMYPHVHRADDLVIMRLLVPHAAIRGQSPCRVWAAHLHLATLQSTTATWHT